MRRSEGPFTAGKCQCDSGTVGEHDGAAVFEASGEPFCLIPDDLAIGGHSGAIARATRIAEALNRSEHLFGGEPKVPIHEFEQRSRVIIGAEFVYPDKSNGGSHA